MSTPTHPMPTPADIARIRPRRAPAPTSPAITPDTVPSAISILQRSLPIRFAPEAFAWAQRLGVTAQHVLSICEDPEEEWAGDDGQVVCVVRGSIGVVIVVRSGHVIEVCGPARMHRRRPRLEEAPRRRGGSSGHYPADHAELRDLLLERGFSVQYTSDDACRVWRGSLSVMISAGSDGRGALAKDIDAVERAFAISLIRMPRR
ncbi:hypothetical protein Bequi_09910 [Brachybacterium sp. JHP9]|uniref:Uncharacterized protein n=1 Tax=Brachybacterium equifaecis TaxID=2910770 RepID=A0ABT0R2S2_9MICO|nr:hypothetical protein [Brachybacterium equifaecis]MCL6423698.1 hypothetical protein [Brachybacterium equifaecis]